MVIILLKILSYFLRFITDCPTNCTDCSATACTGCITEHFLKTNGLCSPCGLECITCTSEEICTLCHSGYFVDVNGKCVTSCPDGYYEDSTDCKPCAHPCSTCNGAGASACTSCQTGFYLHDSACSANCPAGYYKNSGVCSSCTAPCNACDEFDPTNCTTCQTGHSLYGTTCVTTCPDGYYDNSGVCTQCTAPCDTCTGAGTSSCLTCQSGHYLFGNTCVTSCPAGYYQDATVCTQCTPPCNACSGAGTSSCLTCQSGHSLYGSTCVTSCPNGYYDNSGVCTQCTAPCDQCSGPSSSNCITCQAGYLLLGSTCVNSCPDGYYQNSAVCTPCTSPCLTCSGPSTTDCTVCSLGHFLFNQTCVSNCPDGYYGDSLACHQCSASCKTCNGPQTTDCLSCNNDLLYHNGACVDHCPLSALRVSTSCVDCTSYCAVCSNNPKQPCALCDTDKYLFLGRCLARCPSSYYPGTAPNGAAVCLNKTRVDTKLTQSSNPSQFKLHFSPPLSQETLAGLVGAVQVTVNGRSVPKDNFTANVAETDPNMILLTLKVADYLPKDSEIAVLINPQKFKDLPLILNQSSTTISSMEISSLSNDTVEAISKAASVSELSQAFTIIAQATVMVAQAGYSMLTYHLQFSLQVTQIGRIISVNWPSNVQEYFEKTPLQTSTGFTISGLRLSPQDSAAATVSVRSDSSRRMLTSATESWTVPVQMKKSLPSLDFLENTEPQLLTWTLIFFIGAIICGINQAMAPKTKPKSTPFRCKVLQWVDILINWNLLLAHTFCVYFSVSFYALLQILAHIDSTESVSGSSLALAWICLALQIILNFMLYFVAASAIRRRTQGSRKYQSAPRKEEDETTEFTRFSCVISSCKTDSKMRLLYLPILMTRTLATATIFVFLTNFPVLQSATVLIINVLFMAYTLIWRPLNKRHMLWVAITIESLLIVMSCCVLAFANLEGEDTLDARRRLGVFFIVCDVGIMVLEAAVSTVQLLAILWKIVSYCKKRFIKLLKARAMKKGKTIEKIEVALEEPSYSVEETWAMWRKTIMVTTQEDWTKPSNREKLQEIINWTRTFARDGVIHIDGERWNLEMPERSIEIPERNIEMPERATECTPTSEQAFKFSKDRTELSFPTLPDTVRGLSTKVIALGKDY